MLLLFFFFIRRKTFWDVFSLYYYIIILCYTFSNYHFKHSLAYGTNILGYYVVFSTYAIYFQRYTYSGKFETYYYYDVFESLSNLSFFFFETLNCTKIYNIIIHFRTFVNLLRFCFGFTKTPYPCFNVFKRNSIQVLFFLKFYRRMSSNSNKQWDPLRCDNNILLYCCTEPSVP